MEKVFEKNKYSKNKLIILSITIIILLLAIIVLSSDIIKTRNMVNVQTRQALALQMKSEKEQKEDLMINIISEAIILEIESKEEEQKRITFWDKEIEIPKVEVAQVNDKEDIQNKVTDKSTSPSTAEKITVEEVVEKNENKETTIGIDVSKWQGYIDWKKVKNSGIEFVMIRIGYRGSTEGKIYMDPYFEQNIKSALDNGIDVGIYFFSMAISEEEAIQEAAWTVDIIKKYKITYPVAYDFESFGQDRVSNLSKDQMNNNAVAFLSYIKANGYDAMMYGSKNALNTKWIMNKFSNFKIWLAHYTKKTDYTGRYNMWQHTSKGIVDGINGNVDMNIAYFKNLNNKQEIIWDIND